MRHLAAIATIVAITISLTGCGPSRVASASPTAIPESATYSEGGMVQPFYGEVVHEKRVYLFGNKVSYDKFMESKQPNPLLSKTFIGKGPNRMTTVIETDKDAPQMTDRLFAQMRQRYDLQ